MVNLDKSALINIADTKDKRSFCKTNVQSGSCFDPRCFILSGFVLALGFQPASSIFLLTNVFVQWLIYSFETQRNGLVFIYDMCGSNYANFELDLGKKVLNLLKVRLWKALSTFLQCLGFFFFFFLILWEKI